MPSHHPGRLLRVLSEQLMQGRHALQALGQPPRCEALALLVHEVDIVMVFRPVVAHKHQHPRAPSTDRPAGCDLLGLLRDGLMDQCSPARHPISAWHAQTNQPGHGLPPEIAMPQGRTVLPGWWSGPSLPEPLGDRYDPIRAVARPGRVVEPQAAGTEALRQWLAMLPHVLWGR